MTTVAKIAIGGAVIVGGVIVYKTWLQPTRQQTFMAPRGPTNSAVGGFFDFATSLTKYFGTSSNRAPQVVPGTSQVPVYEIGEGYVQGGGNAPIDPNSGGVFLPAGETYGPFL